MNWMKRIIVKMKANRAITIAAVVLFVVTPSPFAVLRAADEQPPRYDADNPKPGAPIDAEKLRRLAWGLPATNGLRAACYFEPIKEASGAPGSELGAGLLLLPSVGFLLIWIVHMNSSCFRYDIFVVEQQ